MVLSGRDLARDDPQITEHHTAPAFIPGVLCLHDHGILIIRIGISSVAEIAHGIEDRNIIPVFHALQNMRMPSHDQVTAPVCHVMGKLNLPCLRLCKVFHRPPVHETEDQITPGVFAGIDIRHHAGPPRGFTRAVNRITGNNADGESSFQFTDQRLTGIRMKDSL